MREFCPCGVANSSNGYELFNVTVFFTTVSVPVYSCITINHSGSAFSIPHFLVVQFGHAFSDITDPAFSGPTVSGPAFSAPPFYDGLIYRL